jgi:endonuclease/exonuclease/phosphatase family metal-dependent hydrolase
MNRPVLCLGALLAIAGCATRPPADDDIVCDMPAPSPALCLRVATFNASLYDEGGGLVARLAAGDDTARAAAAVIQRIRPDLLLLNEFDFDADGRAADLFIRDYLGVGQDGLAPIEYAHRYFAPVNTGVPSGLDLDGDGRSDGPGDGWGFGRHPGQYGMLVLSRFPIDPARVRTFQNFRWADMPGALVPQAPDAATPFYPEATWRQLRLSSKSHWDVPVETPFGTLHLLAHHPTPPVFDGPEDRNGRRNHDEIRLWADYIDPARSGYLVDDAGVRGGLGADAMFVIAGDHNADPLDGDSVPGAIAQLLDHPRVDARVVPASETGALAGAAAGGVNASHRGDPRHDTGVFGARAGNLRLDYVLPARGITVQAAGVHWPREGEPGAAAVMASDHRLVWIDIAW